MIGRSVMRRYLRAALEAADRAGARDALCAQISRLSPLVRGATEVEKLLAHPTLPLERKLAAVAGLLGEPPVEALRDLVTLLIDSRRLEVLRSADEVLQELVDEANGVLRAHVTTALPLPDDQAERLSAALGRWLGANVVLDRRVDGALLGGIAVRVGDRFVDASLQARLRRVKAEMTR